jgi:hypothetical protein
MASKSKKYDVVEVENVVSPLKAQPNVDTMSLQEFGKWVEEQGTVIESFEGGSEWQVVDKSELIGEPFIIADIRFNNTKADGRGRNYVSVMCFLPNGRKIVFNDGGTGVKQQLTDYVAKHNRTSGIRCDRGLHVSEYEYVDPTTGEVEDAKTYYIA